MNSPLPVCKSSSPSHTPTLWQISCCCFSTFSTSQPADQSDLLLQTSSQLLLLCQAPTSAEILWEVTNYACQRQVGQQTCRQASDFYSPLSVPYKIIQSHPQLCKKLPAHFLSHSQGTEYILMKHVDVGGNNSQVILWEKKNIFSIKENNGAHK